jgi:hypothetical protein
MNNANYNLLISKLDAFVRKHYKNQLVRGAIYFALITLFSFLLVVVLEYFGRYSQGVRAFMFYAFVSGTIYCLIRFLVIPLTGMYRLRKTMSYEDASAIIGKHFPDVKDRLLNTLQLKQEADKQASSELLVAAISQRTEQLKPIVFTEAVNIKQNIKYARFVLIPVTLYTIIYLLAPGIITNGSERLVKYNQTFVPQAPFNFEITNTSLKIPQFTDFELNLKLTGNTIPAEVYIEVGGQQCKSRVAMNLVTCLEM